MSKEDAREAVGQVLSYLCFVNGQLERIYRPRPNRNEDDFWDNELGIQEGYLKDWLEKLAEAVGITTDDVCFQLYEDSLLEYQAQRSLVNSIERDEEPLGKAILDELARGSYDCSELKNQSLAELSKSLNIDKEGAAHLKVYLLMEQYADSRDNN
jgi:hypothetical protein